MIRLKYNPSLSYTHTYLTHNHTQTLRHTHKHLHTHTNTYTHTQTRTHTHKLIHTYMLTHVTNCNQARLPHYLLNKDWQSIINKQE